MDEMIKGIIIALIPCGFLITYLLAELGQARWERDYAEKGYEHLERKYERLKDEKKTTRIETIVEAVYMTQDGETVKIWERDKKPKE